MRLHQWAAVATLSVLAISAIVAEARDAVVPAFSNFPLNDRMFYGARRHARRWATRFDNVAAYVADPRRAQIGLHSEHFVSFIMREVALTKAPICFHRIRATGVLLKDCVRQQSCENGVCSAVVMETYPVRQTIMALTLRPTNAAVHFNAALLAHRYLLGRTRHRMAQAAFAAALAAARAAPLGRRLEAGGKYMHRDWYFANSLENPASEWCIEAAHAMVDGTVFLVGCCNPRWCAREQSGALRELFAFFQRERVPWILCWRESKTRLRPTCHRSNEASKTRTRERDENAFARAFDLANTAFIGGRHAEAARLYAAAARVVVDGVVQNGARATFLLHEAWVPFMKGGFALVQARRPAEAAAMFLRATEVNPAAFKGHFVLAARHNFARTLCQIEYALHRTAMGRILIPIFSFP